MGTSWAKLRLRCCVDRRVPFVKWIEMIVLNNSNQVAVQTAALRARQPTHSFLTGGIVLGPAVATLEEPLHPHPLDSHTLISVKPARHGPYLQAHHQALPVTEFALIGTAGLLVVVTVVRWHRDKGRPLGEFSPIGRDCGYTRSQPE